MGLMFSLGSLGRWLVCLLSLLLGGCSGYFANLAREFGGAVTGPSADLGPMVRGFAGLCRKQADLLYLRGRLEPPLRGRPPLSFRQRLDYRFNDKGPTIGESCATIEKDAQPYQRMYEALSAYGAALRALADSQNADFQDSFRQMGSALSLLTREADPQEPRWGLVMMSGASALNQVIVLALSQRTERDIRQAILAAAEPVDHILARLQRALLVYQDQALSEYKLRQTLIIDRVERATLVQQPHKTQVDLLGFYEMALRMEDELQRLETQAKGYAATLTRLRGAHDALVQGAKNKVPPKDAVRALHRSLRALFWDLNQLGYQLETIYHRR